MNQSLQLDPDTGLLASSRQFNLEKKLKFLEIVEKTVQEENCWPNIGKIADQLGIEPITIRRHLERDPKFKQLFDNATLRGKWNLESMMYRMSDKNPMYMFGWLRKWFPDEYDPARKVVITRQPTVVNTHYGAIDAEIVDPPSIIGSRNEESINQSES